MPTYKYSIPKDSEDPFLYLNPNIDYNPPYTPQPWGQGSLSSRSYLLRGLRPDLASIGTEFTLLTDPNFNPTGSEFTAGVGREQGFPNIFARGADFSDVDSMTSITMPDWVQT